MKKAILKLISLIMICSVVQGVSEEPVVDFSMQTGYRNDELQWSIEGINGKPDILSELTWKDLHICEVVANLRITTCNQLYLKASLDYGVAVSGANQDSDYLENGRKLEFSRSSGDATGSSVYDCSLAIGYQFLFCNQKLTITPLVGYSHNHQNLKIKNGFQLIDLLDDYYGPLYGLNSRYDASFEGPFLGVDVAYEANVDMTILATLEFHDVKYKGCGRWNLRKDHFKPFRHTSEGFGTVISLGVLYQIDKNLQAGLTCNYKDFYAGRGHVKTYALLEDEGNRIPVIINHPFHAVSWESFSALLTLQYSF